MNDLIYLALKSWKSSGLIKQAESIFVNVRGRSKTVNQYQIIDPRVQYLVNPQLLLDGSI